MDVVCDDTAAVNALDLLLVVMLVIAGLSGFRRGLLLQLLTYGGLVAGLAVGALLAPATAGLVASHGAQAGVAVLTLLAGAGIGDGVGWLFGMRLRARTHRTRFKRVDAVGGSALSVAALLLAVWFVALNLVNGPFPQVAIEIRGSAVVRALGSTLPEPPSLLGEVRRFFNGLGFPEVFSGLPPSPVGPVTGPTQAEAQQAFDAASASTVRIVGQACGEVQEGSGFVVADGYILTNAHVVAGVRVPQVQRQGGGAENATTVLYDPKTDLAVLFVEQSPGPVLRLADAEVTRGAVGAVLGYPGGGDLTGGKAAVRRELRAVEGRDIYGRGSVERNVYELQAQVRPGNSGGPFVLTDGRVAGIVFAASTTDEGIGYAIASTDVAPDLQQAFGSVQSVSTGACVR
jgi:S1-C subfamily serine protease